MTRNGARWGRAGASRTGIAALAAASVLTVVPAHAAPDRRAGAAHARAAGIAVEPAAAALMAQAPAGTCANDPTLPGCPRVGAVREAEVVAVRETADGVEVGLGVAGARAARGRARAAQIQIACWLRARYPYYSVMQVAGNSSHECSNPRVTSHELYTRLKKYYNGTWWQLDVDYRGPAAGNQTLRGYTRYDCRSVPLRTYATVANSWFVANGTLYGNTLTAKEQVRCP